MIGIDLTLVLVRFEDLLDDHSITIPAVYNLWCPYRLVDRGVEFHQGINRQRLRNCRGIHF